MQLTPLLAIHITAALLATVTGPVALWARKGATQRPRLHRAFGYAWVTLMLATAISAFFIRGGRLPNIGGFSPVHLLIPFVLFSLFGAFWFLAKGNIAGHRKTMTRLYLGACLGAGSLTLVPGRFLGELVWVEWLGLLAPHAHSLPLNANQGTSMIAQILIRTPFWVWGLLAAFVALGLTQVRSRTAGLTRIALLPLGLGVFSLWGTVSGFGASPAVLGSWLAAALVMVLVVTQLPLPKGVSFDAASRQFALPGSWVPMLLIVGIFLTKYAVGVSLAMHPELAANATFTLAVATVYGVFSGIFAGRTVRLLRLALLPTAHGRIETANA